MKSFVVSNNVFFCVGYNVPTLFRSLQQRPLALSKHVTHYGPRSGFLYYYLITHITSTPLQTYDQGAPQRSSVGLMTGNRLMCSLFSKNKIYISNKGGIKQWVLFFQTISIVCSSLIYNFYMHFKIWDLQTFLL